MTDISEPQVAHLEQKDPYIHISISLFQFSWKTVKFPAETK